MRGILGGTSSFDFQQRDFADNTNDLALRQLIWGSSSFTISPDTKFVIDADGHRSIENWAVLPFDDDFDFNSANWLTTALEDELASMMDPSGVGQPGRFGLGRKVDLEFHKYNSTVPRSQISYTKETFISEKQWLNSVYHEPFLDDFHDMIDPIANALFNSGVTKFLDSDNRPVIYGTRGNDSLDSSTAARSDYQSPHLSNGVVYVGAGGDDKFYDTAAGDVMLGGAGQDTNANDFHFI